MADSFLPFLLSLNASNDQTNQVPFFISEILCIIKVKRNALNEELNSYPSTYIPVISKPPYKEK